MRGKIKLKGWWLDTLQHYKNEGWKLIGFSKKDTEGDYWLILEKKP